MTVEPKIVQALQCPDTGKLFLDRWWYDHHREAYEAEQAEKRAKRAADRAIYERWRTLWMQPNFKKIGRWMVKNSSFINDVSTFRGRRSKWRGDGKIARVEIRDVNFAEIPETCAIPRGVELPSQYDRRGHCRATQHFPGYRATLRIYWHRLPWSSRHFLPTIMGLNVGNNVHTDELGSYTEFSTVFLLQDWPGLLQSRIEDLSDECESLVAKKSLKTRLANLPVVRSHLDQLAILFAIDKRRKPRASLHQLDILAFATHMFPEFGAVIEITREPSWEEEEGLKALVAASHIAVLKDQSALGEGLGELFAAFSLDEAIQYLMEGRLPPDARIKEIQR